MSFSITTACNRRCPHCCSGIGAVPAWTADWAYMEQWAAVFRGVEKLNIYGGEPTVHPEFREWTPVLRDLFQCRFLTLSTNADNSAACTEALGLYDHIEATHYGDWTYPGCRSNDRAIAELVRLLGDKVAVSRAVHKTQSGLNKPCYRIYSGTVEFSRGVLYPCCSGSGAPMAVGITPSGNWREKIADLREEIVNGRPACTGCALAVAELGQKN